MIKAASLSFDVKLPAAEPELHQTKFLMQTAGWRPGRPGRQVANMTHLAQQLYEHQMATVVVDVGTI